MRRLWYDLEYDKRVVGADDYPKHTLSSEAKIVGKSYVGSKRVSTVFLGLDHSFETEPHVPMVFETMVFDGEGYADEYCLRYCCWQRAQQGHEAVVDALRTGLWLAANVLDTTPCHACSADPRWQ